mmetsp:Transcript_3263/g.13695  ORF Transcript_3263/g.13695 Transcript_3263/m.13695 type:complete len:258 (-) Transcript_3263:124-897(-)
MSLALAWLVGYTSTSHICTRPGLVSAYTMLSAMSSARSGPPNFMPRYTPSAFSTSPLNRTVANSVFTNPGEMDVTRTGVSCRSFRALYVNALIAAFVAQYTLPPPYHSTPAMEEMLTMCPCSRCTMPGENARVAATTPRTFASSIVVTSAMSFSVTFAVPSAPPALLIRIDTSANSAGRDAGRASTASVSVTSSTAQCTFTPYLLWSSEASSSRRSARRAATTRRHPSSASRSAVARPMPLDAPVTSAQRPSTGAGA